MVHDNLKKLVEEIEKQLAKEQVTTVWAIQKRTGKNVLSIYKAILVLLKQGKIDVEILPKSVIVIYRQKDQKEEK